MNTPTQFEILMAYHGTSLETHIDNNTFNPKKILQYLYNLVDLLEVLHEFGYAHGNIKPANILINNNQEVFLVGFTSSDSFVEDGRHVSNKKKFAQTGNFLLASMNACRGSSLSRRDDIEVLHYFLLYMMGK